MKKLTKLKTISINLHYTVVVIGEPNAFLRHVPPFPLKQMNYHIPSSFAVIVAKVLGGDDVYEKNRYQKAKHCGRVG